jgi:hypothetical protein
MSFKRDPVQGQLPFEPSALASRILAGFALYQFNCFSQAANPLNMLNHLSVPDGLESRPISL